MKRELARAPVVVADPPTELELTPRHLVVLPHDLCLASHNGDIDRVQAFLARCVRAGCSAASLHMPTMCDGCRSLGLRRLRLT